MHTLYTTRAVVFGRTPVGESSASYTLFTRSHGLVRAHAQGVRELRGKHRYALQYGAEVEVTLVRGREQWRVTTARELMPLYSMAADVLEPGTPLRKSSRAASRRLLALAMRLLPPETPMPEAYDAYRAGLEALTERFVHEARDERVAIEALVVARLLASLGHLAVPAALRETLAREHSWVLVPEERRELVRAINKALEETGL